MYFAIYNILQDYKGQKLAEQIFQGIILVSAVCNPNTWKHDTRFLCFLLLITTDIASLGNWICLWADCWTVWVDSVHSVGWICCVLCGKYFVFTLPQMRDNIGKLLPVWCMSVVEGSEYYKLWLFFPPFSWPCLHGQCTERILCLGSHSFQTLVGRPARNLQKVSRRRSTNNPEMFLSVANISFFFFGI